MIIEKPLRALLKAVPHHAQEAARLRALAADATTASVKARLLKEAEQHEQIVREVNPSTATLVEQADAEK